MKKILVFISIFITGYAIAGDVKISDNKTKFSSDELQDIANILKNVGLAEPMKFNISSDGKILTATSDKNTTNCKVGLKDGNLKMISHLNCRK